ncbi:hypothetical protein EMMF5_003260 [Cystobasidiomycetes sp. EMM_F5]
MLAFATITSLALFAASSVRAANHTILVGGAAGLVFTPSNISAAVGDFVTFVYQSKNHSVTQSAFAKPCELLANATAQTVGFDSSFVPVAANATEFPAWTIQLEVATPIWFYCRQGNHCQSGMVGSINAALTGNKTFSDFRALAVASSPAAASTGPALGTVVPTATGAGAAGRGSTTLSGAAASSAFSAAVEAASAKAATPTTVTGAAVSGKQLSAIASVLAGVSGVVMLLA